MAVFLAENRYGKSTVRLVAVDRGAAGGHALQDLTVDVSFRGDYEAAHVDGDNARVYATDSMKNSVYILARRNGIATPERFAEELAAHYLARDPGPEHVRIEISARPWARIAVDGRPHPHAFVEAGSERRIVRLDRGREGASTLCAGVDDLLVLKSTDSAFSGFPRDETTTLPETDDRILATAIEARWRYERPPSDFDAAFAAARRALLEAFAEHRSESVQHTLFAMGERVIESVPEIDEVRLRLPNRHHLLANLAPFGLDNPNLVFVATSEPFGDIRGVVRRSG
jgi:urate oxidase